MDSDVKNIESSFGFAPLKERLLNLDINASIKLALRSIDENPAFAQIVATIIASRKDYNYRFRFFSQFKFSF